MSERLAELIRANQPAVALTGAGVSTESGIPDFRSPTGIWASFDPREYATLAAFRADPVKVWRFYAPRFSLLTEAEPNRAHRALMALEEMGLLRAVVTQNIDLLHRRAGSTEVVEVHGSIAVSSCPGCRAAYELTDVVPLIEAGDGAPRCPVCREVLKPGVVFFDELLPADAIERAFELAREARLLLVVGSSLEVYPVAGLPQETLDAGGLVAVVNKGSTWVDSRAVLTLDAPAGDVLAEVVARLEGGVPVEVVDYDPEWPRRFEREAERLRAALGDLLVEAEHMGSTAVPGLAAKPVVDVSAGLARLELDRERIAAMERLGYEYLGEYGLPGRLYFRSRTPPRTFHVHAVEHGGEQWHRHRAFRDYLRAHAEEAARYGEHKRAVAAGAGDTETYWRRKQPYVDELFERAWRWYKTAAR